jgi:hypothetical protein
MAKRMTITTFWRHSAGRGHRYLIQKPQVVSTFKKRRANDTTATVINGGVGTTNEHFLAYLFNMMGVLDRNDMGVKYLAMDNARIYTTAKVRDLSSPIHLFSKSH